MVLTIPHVAPLLEGARVLIDPLLGMRSKYNTNSLRAYNQHAYSTLITEQIA